MQNYIDMIWCNPRLSKDECSDTLKCDEAEGFNCTNTIGSFTCECQDGFEPKGKHKEKCEDIATAYKTYIKCPSKYSAKIGRFGC